MRHTTEFLGNLREIIRMHESMLREICRDYQMTLTEAVVISFLHNNPGKDTAADIVELRRLQKSNVSIAVEALHQRGMLDRRQDKEDRRKIHLSLTGEAKPVVEAVDRLQEEFRSVIFQGISMDEMECFNRINRKIRENIQLAKKGEKEHGSGQRFSGEGTNR